MSERSQSVVKPVIEKVNFSTWATLEELMTIVGDAKRGILCMSAISREVGDRHLEGNCLFHGAGEFRLLGQHVKAPKHKELSLSVLKSIGIPTSPAFHLC